MPTESLRQRARDRMLAMLAHGQWVPGTRVSELKLARELGTSRGPVREAVNQLTSQGILDHIPGFGAYIKMPTAREMEDLYEFREAMESHAAYLAATRINPAQLMVLRKTLESTREILRPIFREDRRDLDDASAAQWWEIDTRFHQTIFDAAGSLWLQRHGTDCQFLRRIWCQRLDPSLFDIRAALLSSYRDHRRIVRALSGGNAEESRRWMLAHISTTKERFVTQIAQQNRALRPWISVWQTSPRPSAAPPARHRPKRGRAKS